MESVELIENLDDTENQEMVVAPKKPVKKLKPKTPIEVKGAKLVKKKRAKATGVVTPKRPKEPAIMLDGYELKTGTDINEIETLVHDAKEAFETINETESGLLEHFMAIGEFASKASPAFKSKKIYGQFLAEKIPSSQALDAALRSTCKWLYENQSEVLKALGHNQLSDHSSSHPVTIKRHYNAAIKRQALERVAKQEGTTPEAILEEHKEKLEDRKNQIDKNIQNGLDKGAKYFSEARTIKQSSERAMEMITALLSCKDREEMSEYFGSMFPD